MMRAVLIMTVTLLVVAPTNVVSARGSVPFVELAGITRISGSQPGYVTVSVPKTVRLRNPLLGGSDVEIEGRGHFVGFALVPEEPGDDNHTLLGGRLPKAAGHRTFLFDVGSFFADSISRTRLHVHKGDYRLYILPGDGHADITLRIGELQGRVDLYPRHYVQYQAQLNEARYVTPGGNYYSAGATARLGGRGLVFGTVWVNVSAHGATSADVCFWRNQPSDPLGYGPRCGDTIVIEPGNLWDSSRTIDYGAGTDRPFRMYYGSWQPFQSGFEKPGMKYGQSIVVQSVSAIESIGSVGVWLTYD